MKRKRAVDMSGAPACPDPPTPYIVHWPSGPVACCTQHTLGWLAVGEAMGCHVSVSHNPSPFTECVSCENDLAKMRAPDSVTADNTNTTS